MAPSTAAFAAAVVAATAVAAPFLLVPRPPSISTTPPIASGAPGVYNAQVRSSGKRDGCPLCYSKSLCPARGRGPRVRPRGLEHFRFGDDRLPLNLCVYLPCTSPFGGR